MNGTPVRLYKYFGADRIEQRDKCGTLAGYQKHVKDKDPRCDACWRAKAAYTREWRIRTGRQQTIRVRLTPAQLESLRRMA